MRRSGAAALDWHRGPLRAALRRPLLRWMLREAGKRVSRPALTGFLDEHAARMPRTMLSYATEHLAAEERARYRALR